MHLHGLRDGDHKNGRLGLRVAVWLQAKVRELGLDCWPRSNFAVKAAYAAGGAI